MPALIVALGGIHPGLFAPGADARRAPKVTISRPGSPTVTLPITDPRVEASDLAAAYAEQTRPGGTPLLGLAGGRLPKRKLTAIVDEDVLDRLAWGGTDGVNTGSLAEACIAALVNLASPGPPVVVAYSNLEAGTWRITELTYTTERRHPDDNRVLRATVDVTLTAWSDPPPISKAPAAPPPAPPANAPAAAPAERRYTVNQGDTLWAIAEATYGNGNEWTRIAEANGIRDPRRLPVGADLLLP